MAWIKTDDERQQRAVAKEQAAYLATPVGQAEAAHERGDGFFQLELDVAQLSGSASMLGASANRLKSAGKSDILGQIEDLGWHLEHVGYVFVETGATSSNRPLSTGQGTVTRGMVRGIYLFRRTT